MEVKHQVFVSSTFRDLVDERKAVIHALLELDCIPSGMELFPATDEDAWTLIKEVIDGCDYYILILAGKYGSTDSNGVGYTEMEFDYAVSVNKPIIAFVRENLDSLPVSSVEKSESMQHKLAAFHEKAKTKHCKFWNSPEDLGGKVSRSLVQLRKRHPSPGWIPGGYAASDAMLLELQELRAKIAQTELDALRGTSSAPAGSEDLAQGKDQVHLLLNLRIDTQGTTKRTQVTITWDTLFGYVGPSLLSECTDEELTSRIKLAYYHALTDEQRKLNTTKTLILPYVFEDKVRVQFQALGLMARGGKRRAVSDTARYWRLTPFGERHLLGTRAERKPL